MVNGGQLSKLLVCFPFEHSQGFPTFPVNSVRRNKAEDCRMRGNVSSATKLGSRLCRSSLAPPIITTLAAASLAGALGTSARASTPADPLMFKAGSVSRYELKLKLDPAAS